MSGGIKPSCVICAWRQTCNKQFSIIDPSRCADFTRDLSVKDCPGSDEASEDPEKSEATNKDKEK